jgi:hypothetical protein
MKTTILAAALLTMMVTESAMARPVRPVYPSQSIYCATREPGNPHSKYCDYLAWSGWRRWGSWDSSLDNACLRNPRYVPSECGGLARF